MRYYFTTIVLLVSLFTFQSAFAQSEEYGFASFYDDSFQDSKTASGEPYDKAKYTGAHKTLPFGTIVLVTRLDTKESVKIRINDRGPYIKGRIVELSKQAAEKIDLVKAGVSKVKIEVLSSGVAPDEFNNTESPISPPPTVVVDDSPSPSVGNSDNDKLRTNVKVIADTKKTDTKEKPKAVDAADKKADTPAPPKKEKQKESTASPQAKNITPMETATRVRGKDFSTYDLYKVQLLRPEKSGFGVQVASLTSYANAMRQIAELQEMWFNNILVSVEPGKNNEPIYKILLGPFADRETAKNYEKELKKKKKIDGFIIALDSIKY
jgi:rare lipoprotein A